MKTTITHGRPSTYNNHKCRCDECRKAWAAYIKPRVKTYRDTHGRTSSVPTVRPKTKKTLKVERYKILLEAQDGKCPICLKRAERQLDEDHNHKTGEIRGLLCRGCNTGLGKMGDDLAQLRRAIRYLENPPARRTTIHL